MQPDAACLYEGRHPVHAAWGSHHPLARYAQPPPALAIAVAAARGCRPAVQSRCCTQRCCEPLTAQGCPLAVAGLRPDAVPCPPAPPLADAQGFSHTAHPSCQQTSSKATQTGDSGCSPVEPAVHALWCLLVLTVQVKLPLPLRGRSPQRSAASLLLLAAPAHGIRPALNDGPCCHQRLTVELSVCKTHTGTFLRMKALRRRM